MIEDLYIHVTKDCYLDEYGVYSNGERVALDNSVVNGYVRNDGERLPNKIGGNVYEIIHPKVFVGAVPNCGARSVIDATLSYLVECGNIIKRYTLDKERIAETEGIDFAKFDGVAVILVEYDFVKVEQHERYVRPARPWILAGGIWNDSGVWIDSETWID